MKKLAYASLGEVLQEDTTPTGKIKNVLYVDINLYPNFLDNNFNPIYFLA